MLNRPLPQANAPIQILTDRDWQMSFGERAALEGLLCQLKPSVAIEIGTAQGGSLARLVEHSGQVHSFDLVEPSVESARAENVTLHTGDSHELLPRLLRSFADKGENVDFVLVDGDHSTEGVRQDVVDLLESPAIGRTVIVLHDTMNETVRAGIEMVRFEAYPKVAHVDLDFVAGYMFREPTLKNELWGGLGLVFVESSRTAYFQQGVRQERYYAAYDLIREARDQMIRSEGPDPSGEAALTRQLEEARFLLREITNSPSWRLTAPLRALKRAVLRSTK